MEMGRGDPSDHRLGGDRGGLSLHFTTETRPYLIIVLLCVLVQLVQCHKCVQGVRVCLRMTVLPSMRRSYGSPETSPTE